MPVKKNRTLEDYYPGMGGSAEDVADELRVVRHNLGTISATGNYFLLTAETSIKIKNVRFLVDTAISVSTTNYWTIQLANLTQVDDLLSTVDNFNYDTAIAADVRYSVAPDQNTLLRSGDTLELQLTKVSSGANLSGLLVEVEYVVTGVEATTTSTSTSSTTTSSSTTTTSSSTTSTSSSTTTTA